MPKYTVKDPRSGRTVVLTGDSPPSEAELEEIFAAINTPGTADDASATFDASARDQSGLSTVSRFMSGLGRLLPTDRLSDVIEGPMMAAKDPKLAVELLWDAISGAHGDQLDKTKDAARRTMTATDPREASLSASETVGHGLATLLPVAGPAAAASGEMMAEGDIAGGLGMATGLLAPNALGRIPAPRIPGMGATRNPVEASAVAFGRQRGVPIDAATATGSQFLRNTQKRTGSQMGGAPVAERTMAAQDAALTRVGGEIADTVYPSSVTPIRAGEGVTRGLSNVRAQHSATADSAYARLRALEAKATPENVPLKQTGSVGGSPVTVDVPTPMKLAVDVRPAKTAMREAYQQLKREGELVPLQGDKARALVALDRLMTGPDFAPLSVADAALGDLKAMGRVKDGVLRTHGQGVIAQTVKQLDAQVLDAARRAGPEAVTALREGRKATVEKYRTNLVAERVAGKDMSREPRAVFDALTAARDGGVAKLRQVAKQTPEEIPKMGRAFLEAMLDRARSKGKFDHADALLAEWSKLGPETKQILFPKQSADLDNFFRLAAKIKENANPSGTAQVLSSNTFNPWNWLTAIPNNVLARTLYTPGGVQRIINGMRLPKSVRSGATAAGRTSVVTGRVRAGGG